MEVVTLLIKVKILQLMRNYLFEPLDLKKKYIQKYHFFLFGTFKLSSFESQRLPRALHSACRPLSCLPADIARSINFSMYFLSMSLKKEKNIYPQCKINGRCNLHLFFPPFLFLSFYSSRWLHPPLYPTMLLSTSEIINMSSAVGQGGTSFFFYSMFFYLF